MSDNYCSQINIKQYNMVRCIDLFAGAGGLSEGLSEAGFHCLFANEIMPIYAQTYARNHVGTKVLTSDIRTVDAYDILQKFRYKERGA